MNGRISAFLFFSVALPGTVAAAIPTQLYGKSVVISIDDARTTRHVGEDKATSINESYTFSIYVSTAGRTFVRSDVTLVNRKGSHSGAIDTGPGGGPIGTTTASNVQLSGDSMILTLRRVSGARRITATFDAAFGSCNATVIDGKEGNKPIITKDRFSGKLYEALSIQSSVTGCSVRDGNVFGGE
jgi:hypothetical protein